MSTYQTNIPGAPGYAQAAELAKTAYGNAMAKYTRQKSDLLLKHGYKQGADGSLGVDPNNQYGEYQQMLKSEATASDAAENAQRASGWGNSGYAARPADTLRYGQGLEQANEGQAVLGGLSDIAEGEQGAAYDQDAALYQAQLDAARNAVGNGDFNPGDYTGLTPPAYGQDPLAPPAPKKAAKPAPSRKAVLVKKVVARRAVRPAAKKGRR